MVLKSQVAKGRKETRAFYFFGPAWSMLLAGIKDSSR